MMDACVGGPGPIAIIQSKVSNDSFDGGSAVQNSGDYASNLRYGHLAPKW